MSGLLFWQLRRMRWLGGVMLFGWLGSVGMAMASETAAAPIVTLAVDDATGRLFKADARKVYQSDDLGQHWRRLMIPAIADEGHIATVLSRKGILYLAGPGLGIQRSNDAGQHWAALASGLPNQQITAFTQHAEQPDTLYANVEDQGIYRSQDAGQTWKQMDRGPHERILQFVHSNMPGSMQTGWLFAATRNGVGRSMDCFCGWRDAGELKGAVTAITYDPSRPQQVYAAVGPKLYLSQDGGEQWHAVSSPSLAVTTLLATAKGVLYAGDSKGQIFWSSDHALHWERVHA